MAFFAFPVECAMDLTSERAAKRIGWILALVVFVTAAWVSLLANADKVPFMLQHGSDPYGYYQFLPATLGSHEWHALPWTHMLENGNHLSMFTMGTALLQAPFFYASAGFAALVCCPVDGYSIPFANGQMIGAAFYAAMGCMLVFHALRRRSGTLAALLTALLLFFATNLYFYTVYDPGMSHVYAFFVMSLLLFLTTRMVDAPSGKTLFWLIVCSALLVLIRPLNAVALLFPLLYGAPLKEALRVRAGWSRQFPSVAGLGMFVAVVLWVPQIIYWKAITGELFVFTYGKKGEGFDWLHPHLTDVLVSHQNGWFVYTPLMVSVMAVLLWHAWRGTTGARLVLLIWVLVWYTYSSWWCWWLGGSFGHRGFVEYLALLALPLGWVLQTLTNGKRWAREVVLVLFFLLVFVNVRLSAVYQWPWEGDDWTWQQVEKVYIKALFP
jgi:hypothetical protein